jgi:endonuclease/exonuclease/phosphatase (EEP) superfamily protein YafD
VYAAAIALLELIGIVAVPENGPLALVELFGAHLAVLSVVILLPFVALLRDLRLPLAFGVVLAVSLIRFGGEWWSPPGHGTRALDVLTWNLEIRSRPPAASVAFLLAHPVDVVALEEITPDVAAAIDADPGLRAEYPYRSLHATPDAFGLALLSRFPTSGDTYDRSPARLFVTVRPPAGDVLVMVVHPLPPTIPRGPFDVPIAYDTSARNDNLGTLRAQIDARADAERRMLVLGDINTAPSEPAFARFSAGFVDAHAAVGIGPGWTYRPNLFQSLGIGLIRIDVVFSRGLVPVAETTVCPAVGDHCAVAASLGG